MKRTIFGLIAAVSFFAFSCNNADTKKMDNEEANKTEQTDAKSCCDKEAKCSKSEKTACSGHVESCNGTMTVAKVLEDAENMMEKEITVCGMCTHTCKHSGLRMFMQAEGSEDILVVTSDEKFDAEMEGKKVIVTGKLMMSEVEHEHSHAEGEEHGHDEQHQKAHAKKYVLQAMSCKTCACKHDESKSDATAE